MSVKVPKVVVLYLGIHRCCLLGLRCLEHCQNPPPRLPVIITLYLASLLSLNCREVAEQRGGQYTQLSYNYLLLLQLSSETKCKLGIFCSIGRKFS